MNRIPAVILLAFSFTLSTSKAELWLPSIFGDHMVLQRDIANPVWGWAEPNAEVTVDFAGQVAKAQADEDGKWVAQLEPISGSSHALKMTIRSKEETVTFSNIVMGEVWVCSGQSNMRWSVSACADPDLEMLTANYPNIRLMTVPRNGTQKLQDNFEASWEVCSPETVGEFSAVGYYFGRQIHQTLGVPIGLIDNAWGGSPAEGWVSRGILEKDGRFGDYLKKWEETEANYDYEAVLATWRKKVEKAKADGKRPPRRPQDQMTGSGRPGNIYHGMVHPLVGYGIRGVIWYQGESNSKRAFQYDELFPLMISSWREAWGQGDFPFYWVQLADYREETTKPVESDWAELREAQTKTLSLPNTGQAVIYDLGEGRDIHPRDKQNVAKRLARIALARDYQLNVNYLSPSLESFEVQGDKLVATFKDDGGGLYSFDTRTVTGLTIAGADRVWHNAKGNIVGKNKVEISSPDVPEPVAARYAWADNPDANLRSMERLPVVPFRTDDWPQMTASTPE